jgi:hypothetical protein
MATAHVKGSATLTYTPTGGTETEHLLAVPLSPVRDLVPSLRRRRWDWWADDLRSREVVSLESDVSEVVATIRLDDEPVELLALIQDALENDLTLTYTPVTSGEDFPVRIVEVVGADGDEVVLTPDRDRYGFGEWEVTLRLRRTDGGTLDGVFTS